MSSDDDTSEITRALAAVRARDLNGVVVELERWSDAAGGWKPVFAVIGRAAAEAIEEAARTATPEEIAAAVATSASWVPDLQAGIVELVVRAFSDDPTIVAGLPSDGVCLVCLLLVDWSER